MSLKTRDSVVDGESLWFNQHSPTDNVWAATTSVRKSPTEDRDGAFHRRQRSADGLRVFTIGVAHADVNDTNGLHERRSHVRSRTDGTSLARASQHPLRSPRQSQVDDGITRPTLRRLVHDWDVTVSRASGARDRKKDDDESPTATRSALGQELEVIVHEVSGKDSLAGVALKYGISITTLRRANQMWASDSIHLRKVLYIPVQSMRVKAAEHSDVEGPTKTATLSPPSAGLQTSKADTFDPPSTVRQRIPIQKLAYFPTPSDPSAFLSSSPRTSRSGVLPGLPVSISPPRSAPSSPHHSPSLSLTALFTSFPLPETISSRMSNDSSCDGSNGRGSADLTDVQAHEMENMMGRIRASPSRRRLALKNNYSRMTAHDDQPSTDSTPKTVVRTSQLEPTVGMKLPSTLDMSARHTS